MAWLCLIGVGLITNGEPWARHKIDHTSRGAAGDLDVIVCEEREGLGVIWYENPNLGRNIQLRGEFTPCWQSASPPSSPPSSPH